MLKKKLKLVFATLACTIMMVGNVNIAFASEASQENVIVDEVEAVENGEEVYTTDDGLFYYMVNDGTVTIVGYNGSNANVIIPGIIDGKVVTSIGSHAFYCCNSITSVKIPEGVTVINWNAFNGCSGLTSIELPSSVTDINSSAFSGCSSLVSIELPEGLTTILHFAFSGCSSLKNIELPSSVTYIGQNAFEGCSSLSSINIPNGVKVILADTFAGCSSLKKIEIPSSVIAIDGDAIEKNTIIYVYSDSYAAEWAVSRGYTLVCLDTDVFVTYHTHIQTYGDTQFVKINGNMAGTSGESKRLENIWIKVEGNKNLGVQYSTHCQTYGWMPWSCDGESNGTSGESKRLEAIKIQLTGADKDAYDIYYRVHAQSYGWLGWAKNGEPSGTAGYGKRLEGIQIVVLKKDEAAPGLNYAGVDATSSKNSNNPYIAKTNETITIPGNTDAPNVMYKTHVQTFGWQKWMVNGQMSGTSGKSKRLEGINIKLTNAPYKGDIVYTTHVQKYGWKDGKPEADKSTWKKNGEMSGTNGEAKRLEAICIDLTGEMAEHYDIYYRVHAQSFGWLGWAKNGEESGTAGYAKRLEGIQIVLVPKGGAAPADNYGGVTSARTEAYISK